MLIGPKSTKKEQQEFIAKNKKTTLEIICTTND
jgi:CO dehydrogenase/acetyl-CoA synthase epsilon subunit